MTARGATKPSPGRDMSDRARGQNRAVLGEALCRPGVSCAVDGGRVPIGMSSGVYEDTGEAGPL